MKHGRSSIGVSVFAGLITTLAVTANVCIGQVFQPRVQFCAECTLPWFPDLDQDGLADMVIVEDGTIGAAINTGGGIFLDTVFLMDQPPGTRVLLIGDADLDGGTDLLLHDTAGHVLSLIKGIWPGPAWPIVLDTDFQADYTPVLGNARRGREPVRIGHFDGNALPDIFTTPTGGAGKWYRNTGGDQYQMTAIADNYGFPYDWDGDGDTDLLQDQEGVLAVSITVGTVMGLPPVPLGFAGPTLNSGQMDKADIDGNGTIDLVIAGAIVLRTPDGLNELFCCSNVDGFRFRQMIDLDCDAALEVLDANSSAGSVEMSIQNINGTSLSIDTLGIADVYDIDIALADLDGDGRTDLFFQKTDSGRVFVRWNMASEPDVTLAPFTDVVVGQVVALTGGSPVGGLYTGTGVFGDSLYTDLVGAGTVVLEYSYQDPQTGCIGSATQTISIVTWIEERSRVGALRLAPNPADDQVLLSIPEDVEGRLMMLDGTGRLCSDVHRVRFTADEPLALPVGHLLPGIYHLRFLPESGSPCAATLNVLH